MDNVNASQELLDIFTSDVRRFNKKRFEYKDLQVKMVANKITYLDNIEVYVKPVGKRSYEYVGYFSTTGYMTGKEIVSKAVKTIEEKSKVA